MIDVGWNDGAAGGHFRANKLGCDLFRELCPERLSRMLTQDRCLAGILHQPLQQH